MTPEQIAELRDATWAGRERVGRLMISVAEIQREACEIRRASWRVRAEIRALDHGRRS